MPLYEIKNGGELIVSADQPWGLQYVDGQIGDHGFRAYYFPRVKIDRLSRLKILGNIPNVVLFSGCEIRCEDKVVIGQLTYIYSCRENFRGKVLLTSLALAAVTPWPGETEIDKIGGDVYRQLMTNLS